MEYDEVIRRFSKASPSKSIDEIENFLGYLFYEDDDIEEILPVEYEDLEEVLVKSKSIQFALEDAATVPEALKLCMDQIGFDTPKQIDTVMVKFISGEQFDIEDVYAAFSPLEFGLNSTGESAVLVSATRDLKLKDKGIAVLLIASEGELS